MRTVGDLNLLTERISPFATVSAVLHLMQERSVRVVSVVEGQQFLGVVTRDQAKLMAPDVPVREILQSLVIELADSTLVRNAARLFVDNGLDYVPVVNQNSFLGLLTANQLLIELGRSWDPMTGLSWSDRLRDWGTEVLESGNEITLAFFDLNDFGNYNKRHGHVVGDRVLRAISQKLAEIIQPETDILVRYGGDEFVIGTKRTPDAIKSDIERITSDPLTVEGINEPVTFSIGFAGGKRTRERERTHFASTLDNLINLASQDSLSKKPTKPKPEKPAVPKAAQGLHHLHLDLRMTDEGNQAFLYLNLFGQQSIQSATSQGPNAMDAAITVTCLALAELRPESRVIVQDLVVYRRWDGQPVALVELSILQGVTSTIVQGSFSSPTGVYHSIAEAIVATYLKGESQMSEANGIPPN